MTRLLHPSIQNGLPQGSDAFAGGVLTCKCQDRTVKVKITGGIAHNHACGCTKCWNCLLYTSPSPRDGLLSRMPSSA